MPAPPRARNGTAAATRRRCPISIPMARAPGGCGSTASTPSRKARARARERSISRNRACIARSRPASPCARPAPPTSAPRTASCWSTSRSASAASCARGLAPMARANSTPTPGVMKKCTLCIDRIYNDHLAEQDRQPACVMVCPVNARHFGDLGDPDSAVSLMVHERRGQDLMPELGYKPVNKYLPPRPGRMPRNRVRRAAPRSARRSRLLPPTSCCAGSTGCCRADGAVWRRSGKHASGSFDRVVHDRVGRGVSRCCCCSGSARRSDCCLTAAGLPLSRSPLRLRSPRLGSAPRPFISAARSEPGAPFRNGAPRGCRAKGCSRC